MKVRNGFVSNSSSSSFIVHGVSSTMEVFKLMIPLVKEDYCSYEDGKRAWKKTHGEKVKAFKKSRGEDFNGGILIPFTCNYETFIYPVKDGKCYVETCNNHPWQDVLNAQEVDSEHKHYTDDKTMFVNVTTNEITTSKEYEDKLSEYYRKQSEKYNASERIPKHNVD